MTAPLSDIADAEVLGRNSATSPSQIIHAVKFKSCGCPWTPAPGAHQLVINCEVDLERGDGTDEAIAISYAWGEFQRTERPIGHDADGNDISMTLGEEWDTKDFVNRLASLSERGACWIDQLCIVQRGAEVRRALASIPTIYRTLNVVALMPGVPCKCLRERLEDLKVAEEFGGSDDVAAVRATLIQDMARCHNTIPCSSWFSRVWTRQELLYSRRVTVAWTGSGYAPCVELKTHSGNLAYVTTQQASDLSPFARLLHQQASKKKYDEFMGSSAASAAKRAFQTASPSVLVEAIPALANTVVESILSNRPFGDTEAGLRVYKSAEEGRKLIERSRVEWAEASDMNATGTVGNAQANFYLAATGAFKEYGSQNDRRVEDDTVAFSKALRFFAGEVVEKEMGDTTTTGGRSQLEHFLNGLGRLRASSRTSTQARDYINSVWVDCPGFQVPSNYKTMDLPTLFENALTQLQSNHGITIATTIPSGLLGSTRETGTWKPSLYLPKSAVKDAAQVYGPMAYPFKPVPVSERGAIPLSFTDAGFFSLSSKAVDYENSLTRTSTRHMFMSMKGILRLWPEDLINRNPIPDMDSVSAELKGDSKHPAIFGRLMAGSMSTLVSSLARVTFGGHNSVHEELQEQKGKALAEVDAQRSGRARAIDFAGELLQTRSGKPDLDWGTRAEVNHFRVVYRMVTDALGLENEMCRSRGLRLMVSPDPPCIGLTNRDIHSQNARLRARADSGYDEIKTVCVTRGEGTEGSTLYEVERVEGSANPPLFRVFGVWVPIVLVMDEVRDCIFALAEAGATDGYIL